MASWSDFETAQPEFAARVRKLFADHKHHTMATLRRDGAPRISGTEVDFTGGQLALGMMAGPGGPPTCDETPASLCTATPWTRPPTATTPARGAGTPKWRGRPTSWWTKKARTGRTGSI